MNLKIQITSAYDHPAIQAISLGESGLEGLDLDPMDLSHLFCYHGGAGSGVYKCQGTALPWNISDTNPNMRLVVMWLQPIKPQNGQTNNSPLVGFFPNQRLFNGTVEVPRLPSTHSSFHTCNEVSLGFWPAHTADSPLHTISIHSPFFTTFTPDAFLNDLLHSLEVLGQITNLF